MGRIRSGYKIYIFNLIISIISIKISFHSHNTLHTSVQTEVFLASPGCWSVRYVGVISEHRELQLILASYLSWHGRDSVVCWPYVKLCKPDIGNTHSMSQVLCIYTKHYQQWWPPGYHNILLVFNQNIFLFSGQFLA